MKNFMRFSMIAVAIMLVAVMASMFVAPVAAATPEGPTIYISDTGTAKLGDGYGSADNPIGPERRVSLDLTKTCSHGLTAAQAEIYYCSCFRGVTDRSFYENSVLYQAVEKLAKTGGTIVLVGNVKIDRSVTAAYNRFNARDIFMPTHGDNKITIKGQGGKLILEEGTMLNLGGYTVFDNIEIKTVGHGDNGTTFEKIAICACGYKAVFESTVTCSADSDVSSQYPTLVGGNRYGNLKGDTDLTISGGTWYGACGSNYGNPGDKHEGNSKLTVTGGIFKYYVTAGAWSNGAFQYGDSELYISGGDFGDCCVFSSSNIGVGEKENSSLIKLIGNGMTLGIGAIRDIWRYGATPVEGCIKPKRIVDLTECTASNVNKMVVTTEFVEATDNIYYPTSSIKSVTMTAAPKLPYAFEKETIKYDATGMVVSVEYGVEYGNGRKANLAYSPENSDFAISVSNGKVTGTYGGKTINGLNKTVSVVEDPTPRILGAQISTVNTKGGLRFVAEMSRSAENVVTVKDYGFYIWDGSVLFADRITDIDKVYGIEELTAFGTKFREEYDKLGVYNNAQKTTFAAVYDDIQLSDYESSIVAVAYIEYDYNGEIYTSYSDAVTRTVLEVANAAHRDEKNQESEEDKQWIKKNIIDKYGEYVAASSNLYDSENAERLRDIVVAEMNANANFAWTPSTNIDLTETVTANGVEYSNGKTYAAGTTYYGMPYIESAKHELGEFKSYIKPRTDGTNVYYGPIEGINDFGYTGDQATYVESNKYKLDEKYYEIESFFPASDYTGMIVNVWNKVGTNNVWLTTLTSFFPGKKGTIAVGGYSYTGTEKYTEDIVDINDENTMYAAYAACKKGDVVVCRKQSGGSSIYMVMETPTGGAIASNSLNLLYFSPDLHDKKVNGVVVGKTHFQVIGNTFESLYESGFIPVTIPELATGTQTKTTAFVTGFDGADAMKTGILSGELISNKQIISVNVKLSRNGNDGEFYNETVYCNKYGDQNMNRVNLSQFDMSKVLPYLVDGKTYTLTVNADIGNEGVKTIVSYGYTEPTVNLSDLYASYYDSFDVDFSNIKQTPIDHMKEQMNIYWTPATDFQYANLTGASGFVPTTIFVAGRVYKGVLYANTRATLADFEATLGSSTTKTIGGKKVTVYTVGAGDSNYSGTTDWNYVVGNHCSAAMYHGYQKVSRLHASSRGNPNMKLLGLKDLYYGVSSYTNSVMKLYGAEAMYESYAMARPGDFMYHNADGGHTRMVQSVNVVRNSSGKIDPDESYILMIEQTDTLESESDPLFVWKNGYDSTWWEHEYTFKELSTRSIILRPHEFMTNETEKQYVGLTKLATQTLLESPSYYKLGFIESNYPIIAVRATIKDQDGNILDKVEKTGLTNINLFNVGQLFTTKEDSDSSALYVGKWATYDSTEKKWTTDKSYTYTLEVELAAGRAVLQSETFGPAA